MPTSQELLLRAQTLKEELVELRRQLHQIPEFALRLPKTQARLLEAVGDLGEITLGKGLNSIGLLIRGGKPGPTILLRADMDALSVKEETGLAFASTNGFMHACGHDLHMAAAVGAARLLFEERENLKGNVLIWFQPGEEGHHGADIMIEEGFLELSGERPIAAYGLHVFTSLPLGVVTSKAGPMMASAGDLNVTFFGAGGHGSMPWLSKDPVTPMVEAISALQVMLNKRFDQFDPVILNVGWIRAGDTATTNVIPDTASFGATVRTFSERNTQLLHQLAPELIHSIAKNYGVTATLEFSRATKVLMNDPKAIEVVEQVAKELVGESSYSTMPTPMAGGEDFASIVHQVPGAFVFVGACPPEIDPDTAPTNHSTRAQFDDSVLPLCASLLAGLALAHLR
ncbi:M20 family metallopeptidase [Candidatus Aquiluna sp. UB-MaderosW2red]|uniref:M20 metallopeptidase family protein n=1 Tax=Candidatus Aquiluna sp. UB-MaderosW2red TaxID=1855377 RepID=UPI000875DEAD|nr:M20 family metallopeptidase [Candidatus Aquiluna sp. UB-MaderosW2red]SCX09120.1 hippurate hydrolase [Candidatus Aquiluna sp. UB-MaderosW2red]